MACAIESQPLGFVVSLEARAYGRRSFVQFLITAVARMPPISLGPARRRAPAQDIASSVAPAELARKPA